MTETLTFSAIKLSVLFFYRRVFVGRPFHILSWTLIVIVCGWGISFFFASIFACHPISAIYGTRKQLFTECTKTTVRLDVFAISDPVLDALILAVPMPFIWQLHLPTKRKFALTGVFLLGALYVRCILSCRKVDKLTFPRSIGADVTRCVFLYVATKSTYLNIFGPYTY